MSTDFSLCRTEDQVRVSIFGIAGTAPGTMLFHKDAAVPLKRAVADALKTRYGEDCTKNGYGIWTFSCREISGSTSHSEHSHSTAVDINAPKNGMRDDGTFICDFDKFGVEDGARFVNAFVDAGFAWGGNGFRRERISPDFFNRARGGALSGRVDPMHFEYEGGAVSSPGGKPILEKGDSGRYVRLAKKALKARGFNPGKAGPGFGDTMEEAVRDFQDKRDLDVDGVIGPNTWNALLQGLRFTVYRRSKGHEPASVRTTLSSKRALKLLSKKNRKAENDEKEKFYVHVEKPR